LNGVARRVVQALWVAIVVTVSVIAVVGFVRAYRDPLLVELPPLTDLFVRVGLDFRLMMTVALTTPWLSATVICWIVFWRRSDDPTALLFTMALFLLHSFASRSLLTFEDHTVLKHTVSGVFWLGMILLIAALVTFPDGRFVPSMTRWLPVGMVALLVAFPEGGRLLLALLEDGSTLAWDDRVFVGAWSALLVAAVISQVYRYRNVSSPSQRQQAKWVMAPLGATIGVFVVVLGSPLVLPNANEWMGWALLVVVPLGVTIPLGVANAVLRLNLYAIDHVVSRTVSYMIVVVVLAGVYGSATISLGTAMSSLTGRTENELVVAVSVLAVAAVFQPVRSRTRHLVERKFNRSGFERARVVGHYLDGLDGQVAVDEIERGLARTISSAFQPVHVTLWLAPESETHDGSGGASHRSVARSLMR
jgi:hypothetical protein